MLRIAIALLVTLGVAVKPARADEIPPELEMAIQLKILSFDSALKDRASGDTIALAVLYTPDHRSDANHYVNVVSTLAEKNNLTVHGKKVRALAVQITADLADRLAGIAALYVVGAIDASVVSGISRIAFARKLPTLSSDRSYLSSGIAVAVVEKNGKPGIVVHAGNAKECGMMLDSKLLRLAEVVK